MALRYVAEITDGIPTHGCFSYIDTEDGLAVFLFDQMKIDVEIEMEFHYDDDPYKIVMCRIPRKQRNSFLQAIDLLPSFMAYAGRMGYEEYCQDFFMNAAQWLAERGTDRRPIPLQ